MLVTTSVVMAASATLADALEFDDVTAITGGLESVATTLRQLPAVDPLDQRIPFTDVTPAQMLALDGLLGGLAGQIDTFRTNALPGVTIGDLEDFLNDPDGANGASDDGSVGSATIDVAATIAGTGTRDIDLSVTLVRNGAITPFGVDGPDGNGDGLPDTTVGGDFSIDLEAILQVASTYSPSRPPGERFLITSGQGTIDFDAAATLTDAGVNIGILDATANGTVTTSGTVTVDLADPDQLGGTTLTELLTTAPTDLFDARFGTFTAGGVVNIATAIAGLGGASAAVTIGTGSPAPAVTADFSLGALADFENASPLDIINAVAQLAASLGAIQTSGLADLDMPFTAQSVSDVIDLSADLKKFLIDNGITTEADPLSPGSNAAFLANLPNFDTVGEVADLLGVALGSVATPVDVPLGYDPATDQLRFTITDTTSVMASVNPDLGDEVAAIGIASVDTGASSGTIVGTVALDFTFGIDLGATTATPLIDRLFLDATTAGPEIAIDLPISANLDLGAAIGFVGLRLTDANGVGAVPVLAKRSGDASPMLSFDLASGPAPDATPGLLTLGELFAVLETADLTSLGTLAVNAAVPPTTITATATASGATLATGSFTVAWPDITVGAPTVTALADFNTNLIDLSFDTTNPLALFTQVLDAVQTLVNTFDTTISSNPTLNSSLPVVGTSFQQIANRFDDIRNSLNTVVGDPANTLQTLETQLEGVIGSGLGIAPANQSGILTFSLDSSGPTTVVLASLDLGICSAAGPGCTVVQPISEPINLGLGGSSLVGLSGSGTVAVDYTATFSLDVGVELPEVTQGIPPTVSGLPTPFVLDTSQVQLSLGANVATTFNAYLGPLSVNIGLDAPNPADSDPAQAKIGASFLLANPGYGGPGVDRVALGDVGTFLAGAIPTTIAPNPLVSCGGAAGAACAKLPIYFGGNKLGTLEFLAPDLLNPAGWTFSDPQGVFAQLVSQNWDWTTLLTGVQAVLDQIEVATDGQSFGASVPILGDALDAGADVAAAFDTNVVTPINAIVNQFNAQTNAGALETLIDDTLTNQIASMLVDRNSNGDVTDDVQVVASCDNGGGTLVACADAAPVLEIRDLELQLSIGDTATTDLTFDLGLPGLSLKVNDDPAVDGDELAAGVEWHIDLAFGISKTEGFYLRTDNPISGASAPEIEITPKVDMPDSVYGSLAFIPVALTDAHVGDDLSLTLGANLTSTIGRLSLGQLVAGLDPGVGIVVTVDGALDLQLGFVTGLSPSDVASFGADAPSLPIFTGTFKMAWNFGAGAGTDIEVFAQSSDFTISLEDVSIDLGSFVGDFIGPITKELDRFARPLKPVLDTLNAPIPGVKEIAELFDQTPPTMLDLIDLQNGPDSTVLIRRLILLVDFITATNDAGGQPIIKLGDLDLSPSAAKAGAISGADAADRLIMSVTDELPAGLAKPLDALTGNLAAKLGQATDQGGFTFPAFDNPSSLMGMLIGQDVDLVRFDAGPLKAEFSKTFKFGPPIGPLPISVGATVSFKVEGHLEIGYDTRGLRNAISKLTNDDPTDDGLFGTVATLLQGVYFDDKKNGIDVPEIALYGSVSVQAAVDILIAEAGIRGGVAANLDLNLHDGGPIGDPPKPENLDGRLRIDEIIAALSKNPLCLFDTEGKLTVFLELYQDNIFTGEDTWPLASATLVNFDDLFVGLCTSTPVLAHVDAGGVLVLHVGAYRDQREFEENEINEQMTVRQIGDHKVSVTGFGFQQEFDDVNSVFADGEDGNDNLAMQAGGTPVIQQDGGVTSTAQSFTLPVVLCGGPGDDQLTGGDAIDTILGDGHQDAGAFTCAADAGGGADRINGGGGNDNLSGQGGPDVIGGDNGVDTITGDAGTDTLNGGEGDDTVSGGADGDNVVGGSGDDTLNGDDGNDTISAGPGNDTANGGSQDDRIDGAEGIDTLNGDDGNDTLIGGPDGDTVHGNGGDDDLFGDAGADKLFGDADGDDIVGGADGDEINGGTGRDYVLGDDGTIARAAGAADGTITSGTALAGNDTINGNEDADVLYGGRGIDAMNGGSGGDVMYGSADGDVMNGNDDPDLMFGDAGNDVMRGNDGNDYLRGGDNDDSMSGDAGTDDMYGDSGVDTMEGNADIDTMRGGIGGDCMAGNGAGDVMFGDADDDRMVGGSFVAAQPDAADTMDGGAGNDVITGDNAEVCNGKLVLHDQPFLSAVAPDANWSGDDAISGGEGNDTLYGQGRNETLISGGNGNDYLEGNAGDDNLDGGAGDDDLIGGNGHDLGGLSGTKRVFPGVADGSDTLSGQGGADHMAGDNADLERTPVRTLELFDIPFAGLVLPPNAAAAAGDFLFGGDQADVAYGQSGNDVVEGQGGDDYLEGNAGVDTINGGNGQDDMVGGSGQDDGPHSATDLFRRLENVTDEGDIMDGGADADVMLGDNGSVVRPGGVGVFATIVRNVELYDVELTGGPSVPGSVHGAELPMIGGSGNDTMYGQGGNDLMLGGADEDYVEGNHADDVLYGGSGQDDLIGGGSANDGIIDANRVGDGLLDGDDLLAGDATSAADADAEGSAGGNGADVTMGDNARVIKQTSGAGWLIGQGTLDIVRSIVQFDVEPATITPAPLDVHGADILYGNGNDDVMRGQGGPDLMFGGAGDDDMEGNPDADLMYGQSGQDDMIGGSRVAGRRDGGDRMYGGPGADFQLGDNGDLVREVTGMGQYRKYVEANPTTIVRTTTRFDVGGNPNAFGEDQMFGDDGDDAQWGQDGNDTMYGGQDNDDMIGELGDDRMYGQTGEDAMIGDRGGIVNRLINGSPGDPASFTTSIIPPPRVSFTAFRSGTLDRRVDLRRDPNNIGTGFSPVVLARPGTIDGNADFMLGGPDRDSMHGAAGNDVMNGESGGDILFGANGADVMWGGKGCDPALDGATACPDLAARGTNDKFVDYLFGGYGGPPGSGAETAADILDYRPRPGIDPAIWFEATSTGNADISDNQHHQGIDWIYGGWDRDVLEADNASNGPNDGDRLMDWPGATQLFVHCNAAYGGFNDVRQHSPAMQSFLLDLAYALGAGPSKADVSTAGASGFVELGLVYTKDIKNNSGKAFSGTPGHFEEFSCAP